MSCLTNWPAGHNLSLLIRGALSGCRACFLDFAFSCIPHFSKRGSGFLRGGTTGKEVMFIKCAGSAGRSMLSAKASPPCLSSPTFELVPQRRIWLFRKKHYLACLPPFPPPPPRSANNVLLMLCCQWGSRPGEGDKTLLPVKRRLLRSVRGGAEELCEQLFVTFELPLFLLSSIPSHLEQSWTFLGKKKKK